METSDFFSSLAEEAKRAVGGDAVWDRLTLQERSRAIYELMRQTDALIAGRSEPGDEDVSP